MNSSSLWRVDDRGNRIHQSAIVADDVVLGFNNTFGPLSVVGGLGCRVTIGDHNSIGVGSVIGSPAENASGYPGSAHQDFEKFAKSHTSLAGEVWIGSRCVIRDRVTIHAGIAGATSVGDLNYLHTGTHLDHDVSTDIGVVFAPAVISAGRVSFGAFSQIGLGACFHQGSSVGAFSMVGMNAAVKGRVQEMSLHFGIPSRLRGVNVVRLQRLGLDSPRIAEVDRLLQSVAVSESERQRRMSEILAPLVGLATEQALRAWSGEA